MNKVMVSFFLSMILLWMHACSSSSENKIIKTNTGSSNGTDSAMPKEFENRFSTENIKTEREAYYAQKRSELRRMSPREKVNQALRTNDIYLMAVPAGRGGSRSIPGLIKPKVLQVNCKTISAEGMGDVLYGKNHLMYRQELLQYMREFNALMEPYCK